MYILCIYYITRMLCSLRTHILHDSSSSMRTHVHITAERFASGVQVSGAPRKDVSNLRALPGGRSWPSHWTPLRWRRWASVLIVLAVLVLVQKYKYWRRRRCYILAHGKTSEASTADAELVRYLAAAGTAHFKLGHVAQAAKFYEMALDTYNSSLVPTIFDTCRKFSSLPPPPQLPQPIINPWLYMCPELLWATIHSLIGSYMNIRYRTILLSLHCSTTTV